MLFRNVKNAIRGWPWWAVVVLILIGGYALGQIGDGYLWRTIGAAGKVCAGLMIGYWAHVHLVMQGTHIDRYDDSPPANARRLHRAIIMAACALGVAIAP